MLIIPFLLQDLPGDYLSVYEKGAKDALAQLLLENRDQFDDNADGNSVPDLQVTLRSDQVGR